MYVSFTEIFTATQFTDYGKLCTMKKELMSKQKNTATKSSEIPQEKQLRKAFAARLRALIASEASPNRLEIFSKKTGITPAKLSEWQNVERPEWPSMKNFIRLCLVCRMSADYFLFGIGGKKRIHVETELRRLVNRLVHKEELDSQAIERLVATAKEAIRHYEKSHQSGKSTTSKRSRQNDGSSPGNGTT